MVLLNRVNLPEFNYIFDHDVVVIPVLSDHKKHRCNNRISFLYIIDLESDERFIVNFQHHDFDKEDYAFQNELNFKGKVYSYGTFCLNGTKCLNMDLCYWLVYNEPLQVKQSENVETYYKWYDRVTNVNDIIPIMLLLPYYDSLTEQFKECVEHTEDKPLAFYNNIVLNNFKHIENYGIPVNSKEVEARYKIKTNTLYGNYDIYSTTGRPSNAFNGINFAALNKTNGQRKMIQVSNKDNYLIEFDYDSYYVKLVSKIIGFSLPAGNLHEYFGRQYFGTPVLTEEQYAESKGITFQLMFGRILPKYRHIEFFKKLHEHTEFIWKQFVKYGYIRMPISKKKISKLNFDDITPNKLFNYVLQGYETEVNALLLNKILGYLCNKKSRLVLYTYDSFLFEYDHEDPTSFINDIQSILDYDIFHANIKIGKNYHNMKKYK